MPTDRRKFLTGSALLAGGYALPDSAKAAEPQTPRLAPPKRPVLITRETGDPTVSEAFAMLERGTDTLDAVLHVCQGREDDPSDHSVGLGGLPNEDGVVELDASLMHGPTRRAGAVGACTNIRHVSQLAKTVMEQTSHVMMVGHGAERFALAEGYQPENLLTDDARKMWLLWKQKGRTWWGPGIDSPAWRPPTEGLPGSTGPKPHAQLLPRHPERHQMQMVMNEVARTAELADRMGLPPSLRTEAVRQVLWPTTGTIHVSALNTKGEMSGATTTAGLAWKIPGRLGDSPVIGAGCFTDQEIGSAGATGNGEENIKIAGAHTIVDLMRAGATPKDAGMEALRRLAHNYRNDMTRLRYLDMVYYILRADGAYAGVSLWSTHDVGSAKKFVVHDGTLRVEPCDFLFEGTTLSIHPF